MLSFFLVYQCYHWSLHYFDISIVFHFFVKAGKDALRKWTQLLHSHRETFKINFCKKHAWKNGQSWCSSSKATCFSRIQILWGSLMFNQGSDSRWQTVNIRKARLLAGWLRSCLILSNVDDKNMTSYSFLVLTYCWNYYMQYRYLNTPKGFYFLEECHLKKNQILRSSYMKIKINKAKKLPLVELNL